MNISDNSLYETICTETFNSGIDCDVYFVYNELKYRYGITSNTYSSFSSDLFTLIVNKYSNQNSFHNTFLTNKDSALYRKFPDCLTAESMKNYIIYLRYYLNNLKSVGHREAIEITKKHFAEDERIKAYYQEPALPDNWSEIYKQIQFLKSRERLLGVDSEDESDKEK